MQWWAWVAGGAILLGAELAFVDAQFYMVLLGASALVVGLASLMDADLPVWLQWLIFSVLAVTSMVTFRRRVYERQVPHGSAALIICHPAADAASNIAAVPGTR